MLNCNKCGTEMEMTPGWRPSYYNPDNHNLDPESEPYCPKCDLDVVEWVEKDLPPPMKEYNYGNSKRP